ncbi:MAG: hypothetical protein AB1716_06270 [Planctomycetota bacterium]
MADYQDTEVPEGQGAGRFAAIVMSIGAALLAVAVTVWTIARYWELSQLAARSAAAETPGPTSGDFVLPAAWLLAGLGFAALLWGGAEMLRRLEDLASATRASPGPIPAITAAAPAALRMRAGEARAEQQAQLLEELVELMREVRDIELLSDQERAARLQHEAGQLVAQLERDIPALLREHNLREAQRRLDRARQRFPSLPNWDALARQIEQARAKFEEHDLEVATREIDDFAALGAWDRAAEVVRELRQRHPESDKVKELVRRVAVGRERATAEERARLMSQAQDATNRHDWPRASELVELLLARFPGSPEARDLRQQLPTLKANVEIQQRQQMEAQIRDLIRQQRFPDALRIAHDLIERYPQSPQAAALRTQLPRLEERAAQMAQ